MHDCGLPNDDRSTDAACGRPPQTESHVHALADSSTPSGDDSADATPTSQQPADADAPRDSDAGRWPTAPDTVGPRTVLAAHDCERPPERQLLVVGESVVGCTLALLLDRAGFDPLLTGSDADRARSAATTLWSSTCRTLAHVGVPPASLQGATPVDRVAPAAPDAPDEPAGSWRRAERASRDAVIAPTDALRRALQSRAAEASLRARRVVDTVSRRDGGVLVTFENGVREWFDVVVDAGTAPSLACDDDAKRPAVAPLRQYEGVVDRARAPTGGATYRASWRGDALLQWLPAPRDDDVLLRVTTPDAGRPADPGDANPDLPVPDDVLDAALRGGTLRTVGQVDLGDGSAAADWWGGDRVCRCGSAALPAAPATAFPTEAGVDDALAVVAALTDRADSETDAWAAFTRERARRFRSLRTAADGDRDAAGAATPADSGLASLAALRRAAAREHLDGEQRAGAQTRDR